MLYSVFAGRLATTVKKDDLLDLFKGCGDVMDIFICDEKDRSSNYGFIRFSTSEEALKAVEELDKWLLHGNRIIVDIAKDTVDKIKIEKKKNNDRIVKPKAPAPRPHIRSDDGDGSSDMVQDIMYLSRVKETCATLNCQVKSGLLGDDKSKPVDIDKLLDKVALEPLERIRPVKGVFNKDITPEAIKQKLIESDRKSVDINNSKANAYLTALQTVVGTMNSFLNEGKKEPEQPVPCENLNSSVNERLSDSNLGTASDSGEENIHVDSFHYKSDTMSADEDKEAFTGHGGVSSGDEEIMDQSVESLDVESKGRLKDQTMGSLVEERKATLMDQSMGSLGNKMKGNFINQHMRLIAEKMKENLLGLSMGSSVGVIKGKLLDQSVEHSTGESSKEFIGQTEEELQEEITDMCVPSLTEETRKGSTEKHDKYIDEGPFKQFCFKGTESPVNKNTKVSDLAGSDLAVLEKTKSSLQRNPSTEVEDNSYSDSDVEGPSGDSGIESDAISAKQQESVPDQIETGVPVTNKMFFKSTGQLDTEIDTHCYSSFSESSVDKTVKMDDCAIIQNFLQKALKIRSEEEEEPDEKQTVPGKQTPSPVSAIGRGRGILNFVKK